MGALRFLLGGFGGDSAFNIQQIVPDSRLYAGVVAHPCIHGVPSLRVGGSSPPPPVILSVPDQMRTPRSLKTFNIIITYIKTISGRRSA
jgi:hypothetical protein